MEVAPHSHAGPLLLYGRTNWARSFSEASDSIVSSSVPMDLLSLVRTLTKQRPTRQNCQGSFGHISIASSSAGVRQRVRRISTLAYRTTDADARSIMTHNLRPTLPMVHGGRWATLRVSPRACITYLTPSLTLGCSTKKVTLVLLGMNVWTACARSMRSTLMILRFMSPRSQRPP